MYCFFHNNTDLEIKILIPKYFDVYSTYFINNTYMFMYLYYI